MRGCGESLFEPACFFARGFVHHADTFIVQIIGTRQIICESGKARFPEIGMCEKALSNVVICVDLCHAKPQNMLALADGS